MKKLIALLTLFCTVAAPLYGDKQPISGKTFYKQGNNLLWYTPGSPATSSSSPSSISTSVVMQPYFFESSSKSLLGDYFGFFDSGTDKTYNMIGVSATDPILMLPQDIIHDVANAASYDDATKNPLKQKINFNPSISQTGLAMGMRTQFGKWATLEVLLPWEWRSHKTGLVTSGTVTQTVEGKKVSLLDYLQGNVEQVADTNAENKQVPLVYAKLKDRQSAEGLANLLISLNVCPLPDSEANLSFGLTLHLPTTSGATGEYLFEPLIGSGGHTLVGFNANWAHDVAKVGEHIRLTVGGSLSHTIGIARQETRTPNIALFDGSTARFARYNLAGKENSQRLFPFANLLTQPMSVTPGSSTDIRFQSNLHYGPCIVKVGYHFAHSDGERITLTQDWPSNAYGRTQFAFDASGGTWGTTGYNTFQPSLHAATRDNATTLNPIAFPEDRLLTAAAATPAQTTHGLSFGIQGSPALFPRTEIFCRGAYHFAIGSSFGLEGYMLTAGLRHRF